MASNDDLILTEGQNFAWFSLSEMENLPLGLLVRANLSYLINLFTSKHMFAAIGAQNVRNIDIP